MPTNTNYILVSLIGDYVDHYLNSLKESKLNMEEFNARVIESVTRIINRKDISDDYVALDKALDEREAYDRNIQQKLNEYTRKKFAEGYKLGQEAFQNGEAPLLPPPIIPVDCNPFNSNEKFATVKYLWIPVNYDTVVTFCNYHNETSYSIQSPPMTIDALISCAFNAFCKMYVDNNECARYYIHDFFDEVREEKISAKATNKYDSIIKLYTETEKYEEAMAASDLIANKKDEDFVSNIKKLIAKSMLDLDTRLTLADNCIAILTALVSMVNKDLEDGCPLDKLSYTEHAKTMYELFGWAVSNMDIINNKKDIDEISLSVDSYHRIKLVIDMH